MLYYIVKKSCSGKVNIPSVFKSIRNGNSRWAFFAENVIWLGLLDF